MLKSLLGKIYDNSRSDSISARLRKKRFELFTSLISSFPTPVTILDISSKPKFWKNLDFDDNAVNITLVNIEPIEHSNFKCIVGDSKELDFFEKNQFDVVFSNSVIEHVGDVEDQQKMANEVQIIGEIYFLQTPNLYFPIEPHFVFPFFQFLPIGFRVFLLRNFDLGWRKKTPNKIQVRNSVESIKLLDKNALIKLFPDATLYEEKFLGMTKSFIVYADYE